jgi:hypothetical protein
VPSPSRCRSHATDGREQRSETHGHRSSRRWHTRGTAS